MKRYLLLGCIVAITPIMQSASANAADLGFAPAPSAPYVPRTFNWSPGPSWGGAAAVFLRPLRRAVAGRLEQ